MYVFGWNVFNIFCVFFGFFFKLCGTAVFVDLCKKVICTSQYLKFTSCLFNSCRPLSAHTATTMSEMEKSLEVMMVVFQQYGSEHGDKKYLNKSQLKKLLEEQFPTFVKVRAFWNAVSQSPAVTTWILRRRKKCCTLNLCLANVLSGPEEPQTCRGDIERPGSWPRWPAELWGVPSLLRWPRAGLWERSNNEPEEVQKVISKC